MKFPQGCDCGSDRSGRRCSPALHLPPLLLLLLLLPRAAAAPLPAADSSGEAELEEAVSRQAALPDSVRLARLLHDRATQLQREVRTGRSRRLRHACTCPGVCCLRTRCDETSPSFSPDVREVYRLREQHGNATPERPQPPQSDRGRWVSA